MMAAPGHTNDTRDDCMILAELHWQLAFVAALHWQQSFGAKPLGHCSDCPLSPRALQRSGRYVLLVAAA